MQETLHGSKQRVLVPIAGGNGRPASRRSRVHAIASSIEVAEPALGFVEEGLERDVAQASQVVD